MFRDSFRLTAIQPCHDIVSVILRQSVPPLIDEHVEVQIIEYLQVFLKNMNSGRFYFGIKQNIFKRV